MVTKRTYHAFRLIYYYRCLKNIYKSFDKPNKLRMRDERGTFHPTMLPEALLLGRKTSMCDRVISMRSYTCIIFTCVCVVFLSSDARSTNRGLYVFASVYYW